ncbi:MAG: DUF2894 domain-containing protein [Burkholderiales bacterium]|jgi:hypothetical protein
MTPKVLAVLDSMRAMGADRFDPVAWHHIETLALRTIAQTPAVQSLLEQTLQQALDQLLSRMSTRQAQSDATDEQAPAKPSALAALLQAMSSRDCGERLSLVNAPGSENPRVRKFRQQLGKISTQKQVSQAIAQAPQNAGPINSHMLVLRSLGLMRDISPDYLSRFMVYVDTLLSLEDAGKARNATDRRSDSKWLKPAPAATPSKR